MNIKTIFFLSIIVISVAQVSCEKTESDVVGTWDEANHLINGQDNSNTTKNITFLENGNYTTNTFTYPWHCEPGAAVPDNGTWTYNQSSKIITLTSSKPLDGHSTNSLSADVISFKDDQMIWEFTSPACPSQNVEITFQR